MTYLQIEPPREPFRIGPEKSSLCCNLSLSSLFYFLPSQLTEIHHRKDRFRNEPWQQLAVSLCFRFFQNFFRLLSLLSSARTSEKAILDIMRVLASHERDESALEFGSQA